MATVTIPVPTEAPATRLRQVLAADAATSVVAGIVGLAAASRWAESFGISSTTVVQAVSIGLVLFAAEVAWVARRATCSLRRGATAVVAANLSWVLASAVVVASGSLTATGQVVAVVMAVGVLDLALLQIWYLRRLGR